MNTGESDFGNVTKSRFIISSSQTVILSVAKNPLQSADAKTRQEQLHQSLRRLKTDVIDAWRFHEINYDNDAELIFRTGGLSKPLWPPVRQVKFATSVLRSIKAHTFCKQCWIRILTGILANYQLT